MNKKKISFNKKIYQQEAIQNTLKAFKKVASGQIKQDRNSIVVFLKTDIDGEVINNEFANYALAETILKRNIDGKR